VAKLLAAVNEEQGMPRGNQRSNDAAVLTQSSEQALGI
jgi:hypothetical protein